MNNGEAASQFVFLSLTMSRAHILRMSPAQIETEETVVAKKDRNINFGYEWLHVFAWLPR